MAAKNPYARRVLQLAETTPRGKQWRAIIDRLGFDPRTFLHGTVTVGQDAKTGKLLPGQGTLKPFTPFKPPARPPTGAYDPALDAQEGAANRGLADLAADIGEGGRLRERAATDYGLGLGEIDRQAGYAGADLDRQSSLVARQYGILQRAQGDQAASAGVEQGGTILAAAKMRAANQGIEQGAIDTNRTRLGENVDQQKGALGVAYRRQGEDFTEQLARATRENTQFDLDLGAERFYQAKLGGYKPPSRPDNEHVRGPVTYRVSGQGPGRKYTLPNGRQVSRDEWVNLWRFRRNALAQGRPGTGGPWARLGLPGSGALSG